MALPNWAAELCKEREGAQALSQIALDTENYIGSDIAQF